jgi:hypothetical protein
LDGLLAEQALFRVAFHNPNAELCKRGFRRVDHAARLFIDLLLFSFEHFSSLFLEFLSPLSINPLSIAESVTSFPPPKQKSPAVHNS